jgi:glycolate oxidase
LRLDKGAVMLDSGLVKKLGSIVGNENVLTDEESLVCYSFDATRYRSLPDAVVRPRNAREISGIVSVACDESIPVTPRGAGTGLSGGSVPVKGGIVVSTDRMNTQPQIHKEDLYAVVEAGVVNEYLQKEVEAKGLFYPLDPASQNSCTIGGNVGECAGGLRGLKYGTTKNYVLGLEIVTPEGKIINTGARTVKSVAGYDISRLMVGSEGTLGIVTSVILKLLPLPQERRSLFCIFPDVRRAAEAVVEIIGSGVIPSILEIVGKETTSAVENLLKGGLSSGVWLLVEFDGTKAVCEEEASKVGKMLKKNFSAVVHEGSADGDLEKAWKARREVLPALTRLAPTVILEDVTVPRSKLPIMVDKIDKIAQKYNVRIAIYGHAGEGNIHPTFLTDRKNADEMKRAKSAISEMMRECLDLGGTISGEHGIGVDKMPFLKLEIGKVGYEVMKRLKESLDPKGIMNPGKMFYGT